MSLKLCTQLTLTVVAISKGGEDSEQSVIRATEIIIMLHRLMRLMVANDRHREVIN